MSDTPLVIYIAGPYSQGDPCINTRNAILAGEAVAAAGHVPVIPHLSHFWHTMFPHDYDFWMRQCLELVKRCDVVLRLDGRSPGGDKEVIEAIRAGIPIIYGIDQLPDYLRSLSTNG